MQKGLIVGVRLPPDLADEIDRIAQHEGNSRSAVIRRLLAEVLKNADTKTH